MISLRSVPGVLFGLLLVGCTTLPHRAGPASGRGIETTYAIRKAPSGLTVATPWSDPAWRRAETAELAYFHPQGSDHRPRVQSRVLYDESGLYVAFRCDDRYVVSTHTGFQPDTCLDSCVEFFVQPRADKGYFNFELNPGGYLKLSYNDIFKLAPNGWFTVTDLPREAVRSVQIEHSMPNVVYPERTKRTVWYVTFFVPFSLFEPYTGNVAPESGQDWRGNFYTCAEESSHPHYGAWSPVGKSLNFHAPERFGTLRFE